MASLVTVVRHSARVVVRQRRSYRSSACCNAAQNFTMPALSPTMTEGNIASWRIKEGDSYSAGDVLLEIETDKATMDVEAQDDGKLFKITQQDGSKGVKVGSRIAVLAEPEDDLASLEVPNEDSASTSSTSTKETSPQEDLAGGIDKSRSSESQAEAPPTSKSGSDTSVSTSSDTDSQFRKSSGSAQKQRYPLYPSVASLLKSNGLDLGEADKISATGPNGRLLKGDVLSYLGKIDKDYAANQSKRLSRLTHIDLSNIELASPPPKPAAATTETTAAAQPEIQPDTEIALPISLSAVLAVQKRIESKLHISLPLTVFIQRASELANRDLPARKRAPTADDLFNAVLGLDKVHPSSSSSSKGHYFPLVTSLGAEMEASMPKRSKQYDAFDELVSATRPRATKPVSGALSTIAAADGIATADSLFSVTAVPGDEKRVEAYLERMKLVLEEEPGRLVL